MSAQSFKDSRMEKMTGRKAMPASAPARDPRRDGMKNPANAGEQQTQLEGRVQAQGGTRGPRPSGYQQAQGPGMLNSAQSRGPAVANANIQYRQTRM